ncbi:MAG TPA: hypothetical protein VGT41_07000 [Candidatus Babeliales bacterium]|nr:hypothetical protein [Candidatus Babeliales bacterium]
MDSLRMLEEKVTFLIDSIRELKKENSKLIDENLQLMAKVEVLESSLMKEDKNVEQLELTRTVVDNLIYSIDLLVNNEKQQ